MSCHFRVNMSVRAMWIQAKFIFLKFICTLKRHPSKCQELDANISYACDGYVNCSANQLSTWLVCWRQEWLPSPQQVETIYMKSFSPTNYSKDRHICFIVSIKSISVCPYLIAGPFMVLSFLQTGKPIACPNYLKDFLYWYFLLAHIRILKFQLHSSFEHVMPFFQHPEPWSWLIL